MCTASYDDKCKEYRATERKIQNADIYELNRIKMELMQLVSMADEKYRELTPPIYQGLSVSDLKKDSSELEKAVKERSAAKQGLLGSQLWNVYGKTPEQLAAMDLEIVQMQIAYNKADAKVQAIIDRESEAA